VRLNFLCLPLCVVGLACASSTPEKKADQPAQAQPAQQQQQPADGQQTAPQGQQQQQTPDGQPVAEGEGQKDAPICTMEANIGSNIRKRVCRTREQIDREEREAQEMHRRATRSTKVTPN